MSPFLYYFPSDFLFINTNMCIKVSCLFILLVALGLICYGEGAYPEEKYSNAKKIEHSEAPKISLTLEEAINLALKANRSLLGSAYSLESRKFSLSLAKSEFELKIVPSTSVAFADGDKDVGAGVSLEKKSTFGTKASISPGIGRSDDEYTGEIGLSLDLPLLRGFGKEVNLDTVKASQFSLRTAERSFYLTKVNIVLDTVSAVYDIIKQRKLVGLFDYQAEQLRGCAEGAKIKERVGLATPIDVYRAEIRLKDVEDSLTLAQEALRNAKDRLKIILALPLEKPIDVSAPLKHETVRIDSDDAIEIAMSNRVELEQTKDEIREAGRKSGIARHNLLPQLDLVMGYSRSSSSDDFGQSMRFDEDTWSINLVSSTDWARTSEKAAFQQSLVSIKTARLSLEAREDEIKRDVRRQLEALLKAQERIKIRNEQIRQAEGKLALAKIKFDYGMADNFDVIEAETELQRARDNLLSVETEYIVGTYRMRAILGTLIERTRRFE